jgi:hypothetical protein
MPKYVEDREKHFPKEKPLHKLGLKVLQDKLAAAEHRYDRSMKLDIGLWTKLGLSEDGWKRDLERINEEIKTIQFEIARRKETK